MNANALRAWMNGYLGMLKQATGEGPAMRATADAPNKNALVPASPSIAAIDPAQQPPSQTTFPEAPPTNVAGKISSGSKPTSKRFSPAVQTGYSPGKY